MSSASRFIVTSGRVCMLVSHCSTSPTFLCFLVYKVTPPHFTIFTPHHIPASFLGQLRCNGTEVSYPSSGITAVVLAPPYTQGWALFTRYDLQKEDKPDLFKTNALMLPGYTCTHSAFLPTGDLCAGLDRTHSAPAIAFFFPILCFFICLDLSKCRETCLTL